MSDEGKLVISPTEAKRQVSMMRATARIREQILQARQHPAAFAEFAIRSPKGQALKLAPFHREWFEIFLNAKRGQVQAARGHGKTTIALAFIIWLIGTNPNIRIRLFTQSEEKARERLTVIARLIEYDKLVKMVFPHLAKHPAGPWHKHALTVQRDIQDVNPTLGASGILGSVEGGRIDVALFDDISDYRNAILYPQNREAIKHKVYAEILPMLDVEGRALSIATPHHNSDVISTFDKNPEWVSHRYPVGKGEDIFEPLWKGHWTREALQAKYREIGPFEYSRAYLLKIATDEVKMFKPEFVKYYDAALLGDPRTMVCVQSYDLAITEGRKSCFFAAISLLYDPTRNYVFVADAWHSKMGFIEQADVIIEQNRQWQPNAIAIEEIGYQSALRRYLQERSQEPLPIYPMKPGNLSKEVRFMETLPMWQSGRIFFHPKLDPQLNIERSSIGDIVTELNDFPQGANDDLVDALVYALRAVRLYQSEASQRNDADSWNEGEGVASRITLV